MQVEEVPSITGSDGAADAAALASRLFGAWMEGAAVTGESAAAIARSSLVDARVVRSMMVTQLLASGRRRVGYKVGLSTPSSRSQFQASGPEWGTVFDDRLWRSGSAVPLERFHSPRLEPELAFVASADIDSRMSHAEVEHRVQVCPAFELIDIRYEDWRISLPQLAADNSVNGGAVIALDGVSMETAGLGDLHGELRVGNETRRISLAGVDDPRTTLDWLLKQLAVSGERLRAGEFVLTGSWTDPIPLGGPATAAMTIDGVGAVRCSFSESER